MQDLFTYRDFVNLCLRYNSYFYRCHCDNISLHAECNFGDIHQYNGHIWLTGQFGYYFHVFLVISVTRCRLSYVCFAILMAKAYPLYIRENMSRGEKTFLKQIYIME